MFANQKIVVVLWIAIQQIIYVVLMVLISQIVTAKNVIHVVLMKIAMESQNLLVDIVSVPKNKRLVLNLSVLDLEVKF